MEAKASHLTFAVSNLSVGLDRDAKYVRVATFAPALGNHERCTGLLGAGRNRLRSARTRRKESSSNTESDVHDLSKLLLVAG